MHLNQVIRVLNTFSEDDLIALNKAVVSQIKAQRNVTAAMKRHLFSTGDSVKWSGRQGMAQGRIVKINRKKAIIEVGHERWNVPLNMLEAV